MEPRQECPCCGQDVPSDSDLAERELQRLLGWIESHRVALVRGDLLRLEDGAHYLGREVQTLRNRASEAQADPLPVERVLGRTYLQVNAFCEFIARNSKY